MRIVCFFCAFICSIIASNAQSSIGLRFGTNFSTVAFNPSITQKTLVSYNGGIIFKHFEEKHAGIQLEINLSQKGWKEIKDSTHSYSRKINYIEIPFMSHFYAGSEKLNIFLNIGPYIGYSLAAKEITNSNDSLEIKPYSFTNTDNRLDFGFLLGVGINYKSKFGIIQLEGRYAQGIINSIAPITSKNQVISVSVAYLIEYNLSNKKKRKQ